MDKIKIEMHYEDGHKSQVLLSLPAILGRAKDCDLVFTAWRVAKQHLKIISRQNEIWLEDLGSIMGTIVNGKRIASYGPVQATDEIIIGNCLLNIYVENPYLKKELSGSTIHDTAIHDGKKSYDLFNKKPNVNVNLYSKHRRRLHDKLISELQLKRKDVSGMSDAILRFEADNLLAKIIKTDANLPNDLDKDILRQQLIDEAVGLGPLENLLRDESITEIMVNRYDEIFIERKGSLEHVNIAFSSEQAVLNIIDRIVAPLGRRIDDSSPMVDARLKDGSRVNAIIAPLSLRGASLTIRKFPKYRLTMQDLQNVGSLDVHMAKFLNTCVRLKKNILVSGGTGTGKTSLLNILSNAIAAEERIITIEDAAELKLGHQHQVNLESRPANAEGKGQIVIRDLVKNALRMRPDRIVVGECRGAEAFDMLAAMNTGHEGSLTTLHANNPRDALARLETMILMAGMDLPLSAVREHIASAIDIIVQLNRTVDGRRIVSSIVQLTGLESGRFLLQDIFTTLAGPPAVFQGCGIYPDGFQNSAGFTMDLFNQVTVVEGINSLNPQAAMA